MNVISKYLEPNARRRANPFRLTLLFPTRSVFHQAAFDVPNHTQTIVAQLSSMFARTGAHLPAIGGVLAVTVSIVPAHAQYRAVGTDFVMEVGATSSTVNEKMRITSAGTVGVGTASPTYTLDVNGTTRSANSATTGINYGVYGQSVSTGGYGVVGYASAASGNTFGVSGQAASSAGIGVVGYATAGTGGTFGVKGQSDSTSGYGVFGYAPATTGTTFGVYGYANSAAGYGVYAANLNASGYSLFCNSTNANGCGGNRAWYNSSDARLKDRIESLDERSGLAAIMRLRPVRYHWKHAPRDQKPELGFLAQDVEKIFPELVGTGPDQDIPTETGKKQVISHVRTMSYGQMVVPLVKAVQELKAENDSMRATMDEQGRVIRSLQAERPQN